MKTLFLSGILCILVSCFSNNRAPEQRLSDSFYSTLHKIDPQVDGKKYIAYLLIPNTGCSGCINSAESVLKNTYQKSNKIKFVLTNVISLKTIQVKLGINVKDSPNILVDKDNYFDKSEFSSIYPQVFFVSPVNGQIIKKMEVSPKEDGLSELAKIL